MKQITIGLFRMLNTKCLCQITAASGISSGASFGSLNQREQIKEKLMQNKVINFTCKTYINWQQFHVIPEKRKHLHTQGNL